jgi:hypothetical protein
MADLSQMSTEELMRLRAQPQAPAQGVDLSKVSTEDLMKMKMKGVNPIGAGIVRGAKDVIDTGALWLAKGYDKLTGADKPNLSSLVTGKPTGEAARVQAMNDAGKAEYEANYGDSTTAKIGRVGGETVATLPVGGLIAKGVRAVGGAIPVISQYAPKLAAAIESGGFRLGTPAATTTAGKVADAATRVAGGATTGGASAALVNPDDAATGAILGGALPGAAKLAGMAGKAIASEVSPAVATLYQKAKNLGIDIPADRIVNSKPMNAVASSLNYVPLSGRAATEEKMVSQVNRALSRTFGQDSSNVTMALRDASKDLGAKFETTLKGNTVKADNQLVTDLVSHLQTANKELGADGAKIIGNQIDEIMSKVGANGEIDGQAAYNIKKTLDRIGNRNSPEAYYARELKKSLMGALNRSLGPQEAAAFTKVRQQYGNMLDLEGLAQNGAEGGISIGRLANLKNINNSELQDIADITAQFVKTRESPHGAAQRVVLGSLGVGAAGATGTLPLLAGGVAAGRAANTALNSTTLKNLLLDQAGTANRFNAVAGSKPLRALVYNSANRQANP